MVTSTGGLTTEIGLSEVDGMVGQGPSTSHFDVPLFQGDLPPLEELIACVDLHARSKYYPS